MIDFDPTTPGDSDVIADFPANERSERQKVEDWTEVDHYELDGKHRAARFKEQASGPTVSADEIAFYAKEADGIADFFIKDENALETRLSELEKRTPWETQQNFAIATLTDGANIDWNLQTQQIAQVTLGGNRTINAPTNIRAGGFYALYLIQDGVGGRTVTWNAAFDFGASAAPSLSADPNTVDIVTFSSRNGTSLYFTGIQRGFTP